MKESKKISIYIVIGIFTTLCTWLLWNLLIFLGNKYTNYNNELIFSASQYIAAFSLILPSFYLNRIFTFKNHEDKNTKIHFTALKAYTIYIASPMFASLITFFILKIYPDTLNIQLTYFDILPEVIQQLSIGKLGLQALGLLTGMVLNYSGQRFWIYK